MSVVVNEYIKLTDLNGKAWEGLAKAKDLAVIQVEDKLVFGYPTDLIKVRTVITCDNPQCLNSEVNDKFETLAKKIEFDDEGSNAPEFIKTLAEVVITSDYKGERMAFCTRDCAAHYLRKKQHKDNMVIGNFGKGPREVFNEETK